MKKIFLAFASLLAIAVCNGQPDYTIGLKYADGIVSINKYVSRPKTKSETRYGLLDEKTKKILLPVDYRQVYPALEKDLFIVKDTLDKFGIFSLKSGFIVKPEYEQIEIFSDGLAVVRKPAPDFKFLYGMVDKTGKLVIPLTYDYLGDASEGLVNFRENGKFGFINLKNGVVIPAIYFNAATFRSGLAVAQPVQYGKFGYINHKGEWVVQPQYDFAEIFYEGYAEVYTAKRRQNSSGKVFSEDTVGLIDPKGRFIIPAEYNDISLKQRGGVFTVKKAGRMGLMDSTGRIVMPLGDQEIGVFSSGYAELKQAGKKGLINPKGQIILPPEYDYAGIQSDGSILLKQGKKYSIVDKNLKTLVAPDTAETISTGKKFYVVVFKHQVKIHDKTGKLVKTINQPRLKPFGVTVFSNEDSLRVPFDRVIQFVNLANGQKKMVPYDEIGNFDDEGIAIARKSYANYVYVDKEGNERSPKSYAGATTFGDGIAAVQEKSSESPYLVDRSFNKITTLTTTFHGPYAEGLAKAVNPYSKTEIYFLDKKGNKVMTLNAEDAASFKEGRVLYKLVGSGYNYIDKQGKVINKTPFESGTNFSDGLAAVKRNGKWGFIDTSGNLVIGHQFEDVSPFQGGSAMVKSGNDYYLISKSGSPVDNNKYTGALNPENSSFPVKKGGKFGLIDNKGKTVVAFNYEEIQPLSEGMTWAMKNKKWGLVNSTGKELTGFIYDQALAFKNGYAVVKKGKKTGLVDKAGKLVVPVEYDETGSVHEKWVITLMKEGEYKMAMPK